MTHILPFPWSVGQVVLSLATGLCRLFQKYSKGSEATQHLLDVSRNKPDQYLTCMYAMLLEIWGMHEEKEEPFPGRRTPQAANRKDNKLQTRKQELLCEDLVHCFCYQS